MILKERFKERGYTPRVEWDCPTDGCKCFYDSADSLYLHLKEHKVPDREIPKELLGCVKSTTICSAAYVPSVPSNSHTPKPSSVQYAVFILSCSSMDQTYELNKWNRDGWRLLSVENGFAYMIKEDSV